MPEDITPLSIFLDSETMSKLQTRFVSVEDSIISAIDRYLLEKNQLTLLQILEESEFSIKGIESNPVKILELGAVELSYDDHYPLFKKFNLFQNKSVTIELVNKKEIRPFNRKIAEEYFNQLNPNVDVQYITKEFENVELTPNSYDIVFSKFSIDFVETYNRINLIQDIITSLKKNGIVIFLMKSHLHDHPNQGIEWYPFEPQEIEFLHKLKDLNWIDFFVTTQGDRDGILIQKL